MVSKGCGLAISKGSWKFMELNGHGIVPKGIVALGIDVKDIAAKSIVAIGVIPSGNTATGNYAKDIVAVRFVSKVHCC